MLDCVLSTESEDCVYNNYLNEYLHLFFVCFVFRFSLFLYMRSKHSSANYTGEVYLLSAYYTCDVNIRVPI